MSDQTANDQEQQPAVEESDADLEAGFSAIRNGGDQPAPQTQPDPVQASDGDTQPSATGHDPDPLGAPRDQNAELREQLAQLQSSVRNIAGNFGGLKSELQRLRDLQSTRESQPQGTAAAVAASKAVEIQLNKVKEEYPELAKLFAADLGEILGSIRAPAQTGPSFDPSAVDRMVASRFSALEQNTAKEVLNSVHPDWEVDVAEKDGTGNPIRVQAKDAYGRPAVDASGNPVFVLQPSKDFIGWLNSKGNSFTETFWNTNSPAFLVKAMSEYKSRRSQSSPPPAQSKQDRLRSAALPQARGGSARQMEIDEDTAMAQAFARVRGNH